MENIVDNYYTTQSVVLKEIYTKQ